MLDDQRVNPSTRDCDHKNFPTPGIGRQIVTPEEVRDQLRSIVSLAAQDDDPVELFGFRFVDRHDLNAIRIVGTVHHQVLREG